MENVKLALDSYLLISKNGEKCFEEAMADFLQPRYQSSSFLQHLQKDGKEMPLESVLVHSYVKRMMRQRNELYQEEIWLSSLFSAEMYYLINCPKEPFKMCESNIYEDHGFSKPNKRRLAISPLFSPDSTICQLKRPSLSTEGLIATPSPVLEYPSEKKPVSEKEDLSFNFCKLKLHNKIADEKTDAPEVDTFSELSHSKPLLRHDRHLIDVSNFQEPTLADQCAITQLFSPNQVLELMKREPTKNMEGINPWSYKFLDLFWTKIAVKISTWSDYYVTETLPEPKSIFIFGKQKYLCKRRLSAGAYGSVFIVELANDDSSNTAFDSNERTQMKSKNATVCGIVRAVKVQPTDYPLEFYYMREVRRRVALAFSCGKISIDVRPSFCPALASVYNQHNNSSLLMPFYPVGLLDWINFSIKSSGNLLYSRKSAVSPVPPELGRTEEELLNLYLMFELLWILEGLHKHAGMIHGDIKPDNMRINGRFPLLDPSILDNETEDASKTTDFTDFLMSGKSTNVLVLIDFGRCIDMARFPPDTVFKIDQKKGSNHTFSCIEMLTDRPWTFQLDLFNVAGLVYSMVFKRYMEVECRKDIWKPKILPNSSRIYRAIPIWRSMIITLINIKSCAASDYPDLTALRVQCQSFLQQNVSDYNIAAEKGNNILAYLQRQI